MVNQIFVFSIHHSKFYSYFFVGLQGPTSTSKPLLPLYHVTTRSFYSLFPEELLVSFSIIICLDQEWARSMFSMEAPTFLPRLVTKGMPGIKLK